MISDKELADKVIELGVGTRSPCEKEWWTYGINLAEGCHERIGEPKDFVRDPRVATALMEKCIGAYSFIECGGADDGLPAYWCEIREGAFFRNESLPRAIVEACCEALS